MKGLVLPLALLCSATPSYANTPQEDYDLGVRIGLGAGWMKAICKGSMVMRIKDPKLANYYLDNFIIPDFLNDPSSSPLKKVIVPLVIKQWEEDKLSTNATKYPSILAGYQACIDQLDSKTRGY